MTCGYSTRSLDTMVMRMSKRRIDLEKVAKRNPRVDASRIREAQVLLTELRRQGAAYAGYDLASPFDRRMNQERRARHEVSLDLKSPR